MKKIFYIAFSAAVLLSSCSNEEYLGGYVNREGAGQELQTLTASMDASVSDKVWNEGDTIAVSTSYYDLSSQNRFYVRQADGTFKNLDGTTPIYIKGNANLVAYYPVRGADGAEPDIIINTTDQDKVTNFLVATPVKVSIETTAAELHFKHVIAFLNININTNGEDVITKYTLSGVNMRSVIDPYTMEILPQQIVDYNGVPSGNNIHLKLVPQTIEASSKFPATITLVGQKRTYSIPLGELILKSNETTTFNVNIRDGIGTAAFVPADNDPQNGQWELVAD